MADFNYNDRNLQRLFAALDPKQRLRALRGAFRREANREKKAAVNNLRASINSNPELERGVRSVLYKRKGGFRITVGTKKGCKKEYGYYLSEKRRKNKGATPKPVLLFAEDGTALRRTKTQTRIFRRSRISHSTGRMKRHGFIQKTKNQERAAITQNLRNSIITSVKNTAKKYGCK